jgi:hypothetical protein
MRKTSIENIHILQHPFYKYKYTRRISVAKHSLEINHFPQQITNLGEKFTKILLLIR